MSNTKSLERSPVVEDFYGTRIEIWATFKAGFLMFSWAKKILKNILDGENIFGIE